MGLDAGGNMDKLALSAAPLLMSRSTAPRFRLLKVSASVDGFWMREPGSELSLLVGLTRVSMEEASEALQRFSPSHTAGTCCENQMATLAEKAIFRDRKMTDTLLLRNAVSKADLREADTHTTFAFLFGVPCPRPYRMRATMVRW